MSLAFKAQPATGSEVWTAGEMQDPSRYALAFAPEELDEMERVAARARAESVTVDTVRSNFFDWPLVVKRMQAALPLVSGGAGFVVFDALPVDRFDKDALALIFWGLGCAMGTCVSQSAKGDRLGHLRDMSATDPNVRAYQNRNKLNPHTDFTEVVALMCLRDARTGGETPIANALAIHNRIAETRPDLLEILYRGFQYHRRGEQQAGEEPITPHRVPVFSRVGDQLSCRFVRPYIEAAAQENGTPLTTQEIEALNLVQDLANDETFRLGLKLQPGNALFFNNYTMLHARSPFTDYDEEDRKRHLLRMWLLPGDFRETVPEIEVYSSKGGIQVNEAASSEFSWGVGGN